MPLIMNDWQRHVAQRLSDILEERRPDFTDRRAGGWVRIKFVGWHDIYRRTMQNWYCDPKDHSAHESRAVIRKFVQECNLQNCVIKIPTDEHAQYRGIAVLIPPSADADRKTVTRRKTEFQKSVVDTIGKFLNTRDYWFVPGFVGTLSKVYTVRAHKRGGSLLVAKRTEDLQLGPLLDYIDERWSAGVSYKDYDDRSGVLFTIKPENE